MGISGQSFRILNNSGSTFEVVLVILGLIVMRAPAMGLARATVLDEDDVLML